uniref:Anaphylatoxin-like domain-containing protein n=1 Tax=Oncorhynchus mykiss TaxID=8022 RepID=A0A8C7QT92_ONCMY
QNTQGIWLTNQSSTLHIFHLPFSSLNYCRYVMSAPNPLRVGSMERVFVEAQDYSGDDFNVKITVKNFPAKDQELPSTSVSLNLVNKYQALIDVTVSLYILNQYVYLQAEFPGHLLEKVVLVSFQTGYIFVQTDKTIYTPESQVHYRVFAVNSGLEPVSDIINVEIMNPDGITLKQNNYKPHNGIISGHFPIPEITRNGNWKVVSNFKNNPHKNFTADFEVKEYVLPSFEVILKVSKSFFHVDDVELSVNIDARYLFGEPVTGFGFVVFGVIQGDGRTSFPSSLQRVELIKGVGKAVLKRQHIKEPFPDINNLLQKSLYISVNVLTDTGSEMVKAEKKGIFIVKSPYSIHFKKTPLYFKPGMPYDISVYVTNPDDSPAKDIDVEASHKHQQVQGKTHENGIAKMTINTDVGTAELPITASSKPKLGTQMMTAKPYKSKDNSQNYIHINIHSAEVKIGERLKVDLSLGSSPAAQHSKHEITYLILSKGQLISSQRLEWRKGQGLVNTHYLTVNKDMIPSFRIVAYYHVGQKEVVSDSVWVDVKDTCMGSLKVDAVSPRASYAPGAEVTLSVIGDSEARVGLVAVDNGVYVLNDKNRLTQTKIWDMIEKHDTGCTAGSGMDSMGVFYDAGLVFASSGAGHTRERTASQYIGLERQCCMDGMRKNILDYTCERRAQYISDGTDCVEAFLKCCREMATKREEAKTDQLILARSEEEDEDFESFNDIISRSFFPESWLWIEESLPRCPDNKQCPVHNRKITLPGSITSWQITAIGLSKTHGICVSEPLKLIVWKNFFLDLKLPYSAVRNEQLEIKAILHNYMEGSITVRVELRETPDVCSSASKKGRYIVTVMVDPRSTRSVPFVIIPMKLGLHTIEVKASVRDWGGRDGVKKELRVVVSGPLANQVPNTPARTHISVTGEQLASTIEAAISGSPLGDLLRQPGGCGEQNMIGMTLPLIATHYLDTTKQWDKVGLERRNQAVSYIQRGYEQELAYRKKDGSYAAFDNEPSGTWLTAYVAKVFAMANPLIVISEDVLCSAVKWLVMKRQRPNGIFEETGKLLHPTMMVLFVLLQWPLFLYLQNLPESIEKAKQYLEFRNQHLTNPYSVAITSYALANEAYALLALVKAGAFEEAGPIVRWLKSQGFQRGGDSSTQSTIMVFQAVAEYMAKAGKVKDIDLNVDIDISGRTEVVKWSFSKSTALLTRTDKVRTYAHISLFVTCEKCKPIVHEPRTQSRQTFESLESHFSIKSNISLLTGFVVEVQDLKQLSTGTERYIQRFEMDKKLSERGSLIIYLDQVSNKLADKVAFRIHKVQDVGLLQPVGVTVYEYYAQENRCVKFYHPNKKDGTLNRLCQEDVCRCAEGTMPRWPNSCQKVVAAIKVTVMKTYDTKEAFLLTLKNTKRKMPRVSAHLCERALGMLQGGMRTADVARAINCNVCTVRRLRQYYRETGRTADRPRSGRPHVATPAQNRYIRTSHLQDKYRMATTTAQVTPGMHNPSISAQTVRNRQIEAGLRACRPVVRQTSLATTSPMGTNPLSLDQRQKVLFTDESWFCLTTGDGRICVYRG